MLLTCKQCGGGFEFDSPHVTLCPDCQPPPCVVERRGDIHTITAAAHLCHGDDKIRMIAPFQDKAGNNTYAALPLKHLDDVIDVLVSLRNRIHP